MNESVAVHYSATLERINLVIAWYNREIFYREKNREPTDELYATRAEVVAVKKSLVTADDEAIRRAHQVYGERYLQLRASEAPAQA